MKQLLLAFSLCVRRVWLSSVLTDCLANLGISQTLFFWVELKSEASRPDSEVLSERELQYKTSQLKDLLLPESTQKVRKIIEQLMHHADL